MTDRRISRRLTVDDYGPRSSVYLREGYKEDDFELTNVMIAEATAFGSVKVNKFFPPMDGEFHLSAAMAMLWISQLATIYSFYDNGLPTKDREIYLRAFSMKCRKRIVELNDILFGDRSHVQSGKERAQFTTEPISISMSEVS